MYGVTRKSTNTLDKGSVDAPDMSEGPRNPHRQLRMIAVPYTSLVTLDYPQQ